jgi:AcrR family transcriptional regulator
LVEATERVVSQVGFHAATTNAIAKVAGVSIGTLYHYFPTKEALVSAVVHRMWETELTAVMAHADAFVSSPLPEAIRLATHALCNEVKAKMPLYRSWYTEASHLGELDRGLSMTGTAIDFIREVLQRRHEEVRIKDFAFAADFVVKTALALARTGARDYEAELGDGRLAESLADMLTPYLVHDVP